MLKIQISNSIIKFYKKIIKNEDREVFKCLFYKDNYLYMTNGKILLRISKEMFTEGVLENNKVYDVVSTIKINSSLGEFILEESDLTYPDVQNIMKDVFIKDEEKIRIVLNTDLDISAGIINLWDKTKNAFSYEFFNLLSIIDDTMYVYPQGQDKPLYFQFDSKINGVFSPFRIKK